MPRGSARRPARRWPRARSAGSGGRARARRCAGGVRVARDQLRGRRPARRRRARTSEWPAYRSVFRSWPATGTTSPSTSQLVSGSMNARLPLQLLRDRRQAHRQRLHVRAPPALAARGQDVGVGAGVQPGICALDSGRRSGGAAPGARLPNSPAMNDSMRARTSLSSWNSEPVFSTRQTGSAGAKARAQARISPRQFLRSEKSKFVRKVKWPSGVPRSSGAVWSGENRSKSSVPPRTFSRSCGTPPRANVSTLNSLGTQTSSRSRSGAAQPAGSESVSNMQRWTLTAPPTTAGSAWAGTGGWRRPRRRPLAALLAVEHLAVARPRPASAWSS